MDESLKSLKAKNFREGFGGQTKTVKQARGPFDSSLPFFLLLAVAPTNGPVSSPISQSAFNVVRRRLSPPIDGMRGKKEKVWSAERLLPPAA
jgi:hypothetical protein